MPATNRPGPLPPVHPEVLAFPHRAVPLPMLDISSTEVRQRVRRGAEVDALVSPEVARYIETHGLYRGPAAEPSTSTRS